MFHPVTTEYKNIKTYAKNFVDALIKSATNYIIIFPNNDLGSKEILEELERLKLYDRVRIFPSLRFEYFLRFLKESQFIIGNSSAGIREAPYYNVPTIDIGTRQNNRAKLDTIYNCSHQLENILEAIKKVKAIKSRIKVTDKFNFGEGQSDKLFLKLICLDEFWKIKHQKQFQELTKQKL